MAFRTFPLQSDPHMIKEIVEAVSIPVMAKVRIGHFVEAQVVATFTASKIKAPLIKLISGSFLSVDITKHWDRLHRRVRSVDTRG